MATIHILTQYVWPDAAPTGLYAEQLADRLHLEGFDVRLVGGRGGYRALHRPKPRAEIVHLDHRPGRRGNLLQTFAEYASVTRAFQNYINRSVRADDVVIVSSAPPEYGRSGEGVFIVAEHAPFTGCRTIILNSSGECTSIRRRCGAVFAISGTANWRDGIRS